MSAKTERTRWPQRGSDVVPHLETLMRTLFLALLVFFMGPMVPYVALAGPCKGLKGETRNACEKKTLEKWRKKSPVLLPSKVDPSLAPLDKTNPLNTYRWYVGVPKPTGVKPVDQMARSFAKVQAVVTLGRYAAHLGQRGKLERAQTVATLLVPILGQTQQIATDLVDSVGQMASDPVTTAKKCGLKGGPRCIKVVGKTATQAPKVIRDLGTIAKSLPALARQSVEVATAGPAEPPADDEPNAP